HKPTPHSVRMHPIPMTDCSTAISLRFPADHVIATPSAWPARQSKIKILAEKLSGLSCETAYPCKGRSLRCVSIRPRRAAMITPLEFEKRYHNLVVFLDDFSMVTVDVHNYRLRGSDPAKHHDTVAAENMKDKILSHMNDDIKAETKLEKAETKAAGAGLLGAPLLLMAATVHHAFAQNMTDAKPWIARVHMGKGWPEDISLTLSLVAKYKLYD